MISTLKEVRDTTSEATISRNLVFFGIFALYLVVRILAWSSTTLLEDHDSISYLGDIQRFSSWDLGYILDMSPDSTPFYPFWGALFRSLGWPVETSARAVSLFFSLLMFLAVWGIGKQIARPLVVALALLILGLHPVLISLSFSVLTEPSYIAVVYIGLWFYWTQYKDLSLWKGAALGGLFGLAFLNRTEGILYIGAIPILQVIHWFFGKQKNYSLSRLIQWILVFAVSFALLALPQIWRVSQQMGYWAINGRQTWTLVLKHPDGKSYEEKIYGLDFSPNQINLHYLQAHPAAVGELASNFDPQEYLKIGIQNFSDFYEDRLGVLIGPLGLMFFAVGLLALYQQGRHFEVFLILSFIGINMVGPLVHNVVLRHVVVIIPIMLLAAGIGVAHVAQQLLAFYQRDGWMTAALSSLIALSMVGTFLPRLYIEVFKPSQFQGLFHNPEYNPGDLHEPVSIINRVVQIESLPSPRIVARKGYLPYFAEGTGLALPFTDYEGLVKYCELNQVDFLWLEYRLIPDHPFLTEFRQEVPPNDFQPIYKGKDFAGGKIELYRFQNNTKAVYETGMSKGTLGAQ